MYRRRGLCFRFQACLPDNFICLKAVLDKNLQKYSMLLVVATWIPNPELPASLVGQRGWGLLRQA